MTTAAVLDGVRDRTGVQTEERAREAVRATLETLGERISREEARDIADFLPEEMETWVIDYDSASEGAFDFDEFLDRVAERADLDSKNEALAVAQAAMESLRVELTEVELDRVRTQLPEAYDTLFS